MSFNSKGASAPFSLALADDAFRDDALLAAALAAWKSGALADALVYAESVCRRQAGSAAPAIVRATVLESVEPALTTKAWYGAWCREPLNPSLQDRLLREFLKAGASEVVQKLGSAFLADRCQSGTADPLIDILRHAGLPRVGACWRNGHDLQGQVFDLIQATTGTTDILLSDGKDATYQLRVPCNGELFAMECSDFTGTWSVAWGDAPPAGAKNAPAVLSGSPLVWGSGPAPVRHTGNTSHPTTPSKGVHVIIPAYGNLRGLQDCLRSVVDTLASNETPLRITVVDDASPDPEVKAWLQGRPWPGAFEFVFQPYNLGFIEACNSALCLHPEWDALLLNADAVVHGNWVDRMYKALYAQPCIASVTPWSNNGEISSFPGIGVAFTAPTTPQLSVVDDVVSTLHDQGVTRDVDIPTGCGFAMLMRRSVINQVGILDGVHLNRGYSEEVDWCLRASSAGYRHLLATGVFVAHAGTASFGYEKTYRAAQNRNVIHARYPGFYSDYRAFLRTDPIQSIRKAILGALEEASPDWPNVESANAKRRTPSVFRGAALASECKRIGVQYDDMSRAGRRKILTLARQMATSRLNPPVRLLVLGQPTEALYRTGVVDGMPPAALRDAGLITDTLLLGWCGCIHVLGEPKAGTNDDLRFVPVHEGFEPAAWWKQHFHSDRRVV